jgi:hypothetical protein
MLNGKPGDAPWTDFFVHSRDIFPEDITAMLKAIYAVSTSLTFQVGSSMWDWKAGRDLEAGRAKLKQIIADNNIPFKG